MKNGLEVLDMIRTGCRVIAIAALLSFLLHTPASARKDDGEWNEKLKQLEQIWVYDGSGVHNVGNLQMHVCNWGCLGSYPGSTWPIAEYNTSDMPVCIEQHVEWIADLIAHAKSQGITQIEAEPTSQEDWVRHVNEIAAMTLFVQADSWYLGANIPGKPRVFMPYPGGMGNYRIKCDEVAASGYPGFSLLGPSAPEPRTATG